jgi:hypothetical protein
MTVRRLFPGAAAAALAVGLASAAAFAAGARAAGPPPKKGEAPTANPCAEVKNCKSVDGPWVAVPASGEATFLLECPKRAGTIGGTDALVSSKDVRVTWEGNTGSPVRPGTTTIYFAFFHAASAKGKVGFFQPYIGCIPPEKVNPRSTVSARITKPEGFLDRRQTLFALKVGKQKASQSCKKGERLLSGWHTVVFGTAAAPDPKLVSKVHVLLTIANGKVLAAIQTDPGMPPSAHAELQLGAVCAK